jgi:hypothetical protein
MTTSTNKKTLFNFGFVNTTNNKFNIPNHDNNIQTSSTSLNSTPPSHSSTTTNHQSTISPLHDKTVPDTNNSITMNDEEITTEQQQQEEPEEVTTAPVDYAALRLQRLQANQAVLASLGLLETSASINASNKQQRSSSTQVSNNKRSRTTPTELLPLRRSSRKSALTSVYSSDPTYSSATETSTADTTNTTSPATISPPDPLIFQPLFDPSQLLPTTNNNECNAATTPPIIPSTSFLQPKFSITTSIAKSYTLDFHPSLPLVCAGGHNGQCSILKYTLEKQEEIVSWRAHHGWISSSCFFPIGSNSSATTALVLTSSNDGQIALWDSSQIDQKSNCKQIWVEDSIHDSGIFDMQPVIIDNDESLRIVTASKDGTVKVCSLNENGIGLNKIWSYNHGNVVKTSRFSPLDRNMIASAGNSRQVLIHDIRSSSSSSSSSAQIQFEERPTAINVIRWSPSNPNMLLSAGNDPQICVLDIRYPTSTPTYLFGHCQPHDSRSDHIYQPSFCGNGRYVVACGGSAREFSLFDLKTSNNPIIAAKMRSNNIQYMPIAVVEFRGMLGVSHGKFIHTYDVVIEN